MTTQSIPLNETDNELSTHFWKSAGAIIENHWNLNSGFDYFITYNTWRSRAGSMDIKFCRYNKGRLWRLTDAVVNSTIYLKRHWWKRMHLKTRNTWKHFPDSWKKREQFRISSYYMCVMRIENHHKMSRITRKRIFGGFSPRKHSNQPAHLQKLAGILKLWI